MKPLTYHEIALNMETQHLFPIRTSCDKSRHDWTTPAQREILRTRPCPCCKHAPRNISIFNSRDYHETKVFARCPTCGHCEQI